MRSYFSFGVSVGGACRLLAGCLAVALCAAPAAWGGDTTTLSVERSTSACTDVLTDGYVPGEPVTVTVTISRTGDGDVTALGYYEFLPNGWTFAETFGPSAPDLKPSAGATGELNFAWFQKPPFPRVFSIVLNPPAVGSGEACLSGYAEYRLGGPAIETDTIQNCLTENATCPLPDPCVSYTRSAPAEYEGGAPVDISLTIDSTCGAGLEALTIQEQVPVGWTVSNVTGAPTPTNDPAEGVLDFVFASVPVFPATLSYRLTPPAEATGQACITGRALHTVVGTELQSALTAPSCILGPPCVRFTRSEILCPLPGETFDVTVTIEDDCAQPLTAFGLRESLPDGWTPTPVGGATAPNFVSFSTDTQTWDFVWFTIPERPFSFDYQVTVPGDSAEPFALSGQVEFRTGGAAEFSDVVVTECLDDVTCSLNLRGNQTVNIACGTTFVDPGTETVCDRPRPADYIVTTIGTVNSGQPGPYNLRYELRNGAGDLLDSVSRVVNVTDAIAPTLTLNGGAAFTVECGAPFVDPGATALDVCAGDLSAQVVRTGTVNTAVPGAYTLTYNVADPAGNAAAPVQRTVTVADTTAPTITLSGQPTLILSFLQPYVEAGFTATDTCGGDLTAGVTVSGTVNVQEAAIYTLTYRVTDAAGNTGTTERTVIVNQGPPPTLTLNGANPLFVECGDAYTEPGATATDVLDGDLSDTVFISSTVDPEVPGIYSVTYRVTNARGQTTGPIARAVVVEDTGAPTVTLTGEAAVTVECGTAYTDAGATATDTCDGDVSASIVAGPGPLVGDTLAKVFKAGENYVNTGVPGIYQIAFQAEDAAGNVSAPALRTVTVEDTTPPSIALVGAAEVFALCGEPFFDQGATASDTCGGNLTGAVVVDGAVDTGAPGVYTLTYTVADPSGNEASVSRTVTVEDSTAPTLTLLGANPLGAECGVPFDDPGATATDACDDNVAITSDAGLVDTNTPGTYLVTYTARDASGNQSSRVREVVVLECETEGEGEGVEEGEGEPDPCALDPVAGFSMATPAADATYLLHDNARAADVILTAVFDFEPGCGGEVEVTYEVNDVVVGTSDAIDFAFPVTISRGLGEYVVVATALVKDYGYSVAAATTFRVKRGVDSDSNGYIDNPFELDPEIPWNASVGAGDGNRTVGAVSWNGTAKDDSSPANTWTKQSGGSIGVVLSNPDAPEQSLSVTAPRDLVRAGERGVLLVALGTTPGRLLAPADTAALEAGLPRDPIAGAAYFDVSIIISLDGGTSFIPLPAERLAANPVQVTLTGLAPDPDAIPSFFSYPTQVVRDAQTGIAIVPGAGEWSNRNVRNVVRGDDRLSAELAGLSAFAPIEQENVPPRLSIAPDPGGTFDFGEIVVGTSATQAFDVSNIGGLVLSGAVSLTDPKGVFSLEGATNFDLANGETARVVLRFAPSDGEAYVAQIRFEGGDQGPVVVEVYGAGQRKLIQLFGCGGGSGGGAGAGDLLLAALLGLGLLAGTGVRRATRG